MLVGVNSQRRGEDPRLCECHGRRTCLLLGRASGAAGGTVVIAALADTWFLSGDDIYVRFGSVGALAAGGFGSMWEGGIHYVGCCVAYTCAGAQALALEEEREAILVSEGLSEGSTAG